MSETAGLGTEASVDTGSAEGPGTESVGDQLGTEGPPSEVSTDTELGTPPSTYAVKIGDEEQQVTLEDLQSGFMRQADYTRKTQEVAAQRQRLAHAESIANSLEADPEGTLRALAEAFGVGVGDQGFDPEEADPTEARLRGLESTIQAQKAQEVRAQIDGEIDSLLKTHGDFDLASVIQHAATHGMTVTSAFRDLNFDTFATKAKESEVLREQKRDAAVVEGGQHRSGVSTKPSKASNIREAWAAAKQTLSA